MLNKIYSRYEGYKLNLDGTLNCKENLDNLDELNEWFYSKKYANMIVKSNKGKFIYVTWNGDQIDYFKSNPLEELEAFLNSYKAGK